MKSYSGSYLYLRCAYVHRLDGKKSGMASQVLTKSSSPTQFRLLYWNFGKKLKLRQPLAHSGGLRPLGHHTPQWQPNPSCTAQPMKRPAVQHTSKVASWSALKQVLKQLQRLASALALFARVGHKFYGAPDMCHASIDIHKANILLCSLCRSGPHLVGLDVAVQGSRGSPLLCPDLLCTLGKVPAAARDVESQSSINQHVRNHRTPPSQVFLLLMHQGI